jgi:hypothetical protein
LSGGHAKLSEACFLGVYGRDQAIPDALTKNLKRGKRDSLVGEYLLPKSSPVVIKNHLECSPLIEWYAKRLYKSEGGKIMNTRIAAGVLFWTIIIF